MLLLLRILLRYAVTFCALEQIQEPTTAVKRPLEQLYFAKGKSSYKRNLPRKLKQ